MYNAMQEGKGRDMIGTVIASSWTILIIISKRRNGCCAENGYPEYDAHKVMHDNLSEKQQPSKRLSKGGIHRRDRGDASPNKLAEYPHPREGYEIKPYTEGRATSSKECLI